MAAAEVGQRRRRDHAGRPARRAGATKISSRVRAGDGMHRIEAHAEVAAAQQPRRSRRSRTASPSGRRGRRPDRRPRPASSPSVVTPMRVEIDVGRGAACGSARSRSLCVQIASVIFSGAGPPLPALYLMPKSPSGPPGLWLADRMMPPNARALADRRSSPPASTGCRAGRPGSRPKPFAAAMRTIVWIATSLWKRPSPPTTSVAAGVARRARRRSTGRSSRGSAAAGTPRPSCAGRTCRGAGRRTAGSGRSAAGSSARGRRALRGAVAAENVADTAPPCRRWSSSSCSRSSPSSRSAGARRRSGRLGSGDPARVLAGAAFYIFVPALLFRTSRADRLRAARRPHRPRLLRADDRGAGAGLPVPAPARARRGSSAPAAPSVRAITASFGNAVQVGIPLAAALYGEAGLALHITLVSLHALILLTVLTALVELDLARAAAAQRRRRRRGSCARSRPRCATPSSIR